MAKALVTMLSIMVLFAAIAGKVAAQDNSGNPSILQAVHNLQAAVDALADTVNGSQTPPAVIATGFLFKPAGYSAGCNAQNVGDASVTVEMELMKIDGTVLQDVPSLTLAAGNGNGFSQSLGSLPSFVWCRFTITNGSSANLRADLGIVVETTGLAQSTREAR